MDNFMELQRDLDGLFDEYDDPDICQESVSPEMPEMDSLDFSFSKSYDSDEETNTNKEDVIINEETESLFNEIGNSKDEEPVSDKKTTTDDSLSDAIKIIKKEINNSSNNGCNANDFIEDEVKDCEIDFGPEDEIDEGDIIDLDEDAIIIEEVESFDESASEILNQNIGFEQQEHLTMDGKFFAFMFTEQETDNNSENTSTTTNIIRYPAKIKISRIIKQIVSVAAMAGLVIGIPLLLSVDKHKNNDSINNMESCLYLENVPQVQNTAFENASLEINEVIENGTSNSRFETVQDLSLYIDSNMGVILSAEKQAVMQYSSGTIGKDKFYELMEKHISAADDLNHLLKANKNTYCKAGLTETYNSLSEDMDVLLLYGDTVIYNAEMGIYCSVNN